MRIQTYRFRVKGLGTSDTKVMFGCVGSGLRSVGAQRGNITIMICDLLVVTACFCYDVWYV